MCVYSSCEYDLYYISSGIPGIGDLRSIRTMVPVLSRKGSFSFGFQVSFLIACIDEDDVRLVIFFYHCAHICYRIVSG